MPALVVVGLQWGDEGKGRVIHSLARHAHAVARYQGGNNAGHTLVLGPKDILALHLVPSGIVYPKVRCYIGNGVVVDPKSLQQETEMLAARGIKVQGRLKVSPLSHVILPYHLQFEHYLGEGSRLGTTQRGIGPSYRDKIARVGIRVIDYLDEEIFKERAISNIRDLLTPFAKPQEIRFIEEQTLSDRETLAPFLKSIVGDVSLEIHQALERGRRVILESAQGTFLDVDFGTYPYVTSSNPLAGYAPCGVGIGPQAIEVVLGIAKLFTTRVGEGPFPTELQGDLAHQIRETGQEYGATTGRPRRIGWLDLPLLKKACRINGVNRLALTKLDTLAGLSKIQVCVGYSYQGQILRELPDGLRALKEAQPIYKELPGFEGDLTSVTRYQDLPKNAKKLLEVTLDFLKVPAAIVSVGRRPQNQIILDQKFCKTWM